MFHSYSSSILMTRTVSTCGVKYCRQKKTQRNRIQSTILPPWIFPFWQMFSWTNFPKRLELLLYTVFALPKASMMGLKRSRTAAVLMRTDLKNSKDSPHRRPNTQVQEKSEIKRTNGDYVPWQKSQISKALAEMGLSRTSTSSQGWLCEPRMFHWVKEVMMARPWTT